MSIVVEKIKKYFKKNIVYQSLKKILQRGFGGRDQFIKDDYNVYVQIFPCLPTCPKQTHWRNMKNNIEHSV